MTEEQLTAAIAAELARPRPPMSGYVGVSRARDRWQASVYHNRKMVYLGVYRDPFSAAWVRDQYAAPLGRKLNDLVDRRRTTRITGIFGI